MRHRIEYAAMRALRCSMTPLPLDMASGVGAGIARALGRWPSVRRRARRNLVHAMPEMPEGERERILTAMFDSFGRWGVELLKRKRFAEDTARFAVEGIEHLHAAASRGRGVVVLSAHYANSEAVRLALAQHDLVPALIYRTLNNPLIEAEMREGLEALGAPVFRKGKRGTLGLLRHVKAGGVAMILADQRFSGAPFLPFFGKPARTTLAPAEMALGHGAALLTAHAEREGRSSRFRIHVDPPIPTEGRDAEAIMADYNARLEGWIRKRPGQYFWLHHRWGPRAVGAKTAPSKRTPPPGAEASERGPGAD